MSPTGPYRFLPTLRPQPNLAGTEAGATPSPACPRVAQASLPAIPDSARSPAQSNLAGTEAGATSDVPAKALEAIV